MPVERRLIGEESRYSPPSPYILRRAGRKFARIEQERVYRTYELFRECRIQNPWNIPDLFNATWVQRLTGFNRIQILRQVVCWKCHSHQQRKWQ